MSTASDGSYSATHSRYSLALSSALDHARSLLAHPDSKSWKALTPPLPSTTAGGARNPTSASHAATSTSTTSPPASDSKGKSGLSPPHAAPPSLSPSDLPSGLSPLAPSSVTVHRRTDKERGCDGFRAVAEVALDPAVGRAEEVVERARAVLATGEVRGLWDKLVEQQTTLELLDPHTRIVKTDYRLGWPASPRDTITISRTHLSPSPSSSSSSSPSASTSPPSSAYPSLLDLSTSLPRPSPSASPSQGHGHAQDDEPAFLRPAPPFVRAHLWLGAWGVEVLPPLPSDPPADPSPSTASSSSSTAAPPPPARLRLTLLWQWSLRSPLPSTTFSPSSSSSSSSAASKAQAAHLAQLLSSFVDALRSPSSAVSAAAGERIPLLRGYGRGVSVNRDEWDAAGERRGVEYAVVHVDAESGSGFEGAGAEGGEGGEGAGEERRWKERSVELSLPKLGVLFDPLPVSSTGAEGDGLAAGAMDGSGGGAGTGDGWDVRVTVKPLGGEGVSAAYAVRVLAPCSGPFSSSSSPSASSSLSPSPGSSSNPLLPAGRLTLLITHSPLASPSHLVRATVTVQRLAGGGCVRVNGARQTVERVAVEAPDGGKADGKGDGRRERGLPGGVGAADDAASIRTTSSSASSSPDDPPLESALSIRSATSRTTTALSPAQQRASDLSSLLRRSYIYFLSLLQEPPAKWRHVTDSAGVSVTQLLSPDPTLTIYRAEAVFVGVGVWDVFATVVTPGCRRGWERGVEGVELVGGAWGDGTGEEEGEGGLGGLSEVWWERRKGQWPVAPRDSVLLRTAYKSPSSIHVFSSSPPSPSPSSSSSSSSSDPSTSHALFPGIPPPAPGTIRTHTDLLGWSIEALSPTTTQITLLDQSDPKGWSSKSSWTPGAMVQAVAGVRDWTMRRGAPPVVTRLSGGVRKTREEYDPERGALRVEYAPFGSLAASASSSPAIASPPTSPDPTSSSSTAAAASSLDRTELEIRCDASGGSGSGGGGGGGIEVMVDPPPLRVACLSRHRLSAGGGLWLTIEHDRAKVVRGEGKVVVTVRRAVGGSGASAAPAVGAGGAGAGGASTTTPVTVNGARVKVDVELLDEEKVRELEKRKRVKARPVPLDQYETLGPRAGGGAVVQSAGGRGATAPSATAAVEKEIVLGAEGEKPDAKGEEVKSAAAAAGAAGVTDDPQAAGAVLSAAGEGGSPNLSGDSSSVAASGDVLSPSAASAAAFEASKPPLDPPACALEALAWLQTFHAEQGPELTDPAPGWAIVSERGGAVVRKKVLPRVAPDVPVCRGDKIVQGLTADEIAAVVTAPGCRKAWDERVESAVPLASYGHGISTSVLTTKPAFPFKGRVFYVASANASVKVPSASSAASTSTVRFVASASYTPPAEHFDPVKLNPSALPSGQVYLEGWILETLDPYTSSVLAIPSTRCTYVACIDPKLGNLSSLGLAGSNGGVNLARTIANVEQLGKLKGPLPRLAEPTNGVQIEGPLSDDGEVDCVWKLAAERGKASEVVAVDYDPAGATEGGAYRALFKVGGAAQKKRLREPSASSLVGGGAGANDEVDLTRKASERRTVSSSALGVGGGGGGGAGKNKPPSLLSPSLPVGTTLLKSELPRSASLNFGTAAPPILQKPPITSELAHKSSRSSLRSRSPPGALTSSSSSPAVPSVSGASSSAASTVVPTPKGSQTTITDPGVHDLVVAELVVDLKQYPHGYSVAASSLIIPAVSPQGGSPDEPLSLESLPPRSSSSPSSSSSSAISSTTPTQIPLRCTAHDAPLPSILTASLDAWKRANHVVRVLVPTGAITHPIKDPLRTDENGESSTSTSSSSSSSATPGGGGNKPEWFRLLMDGEGALVEIKITPLPAPPPSTTAAGKAKERERQRAEQEAGAAGRVTGQAARSAVFNGEKVTVLSQKESKAVLARFEDDDAPLQGARISRVPPRKRRKSSTVAELEAAASPSSALPVELQQPLAIAVRLLAPKPITPVLDDFDFPDPKSPGSVTPADVESRSPVLGKASFKPAISRRDTASSADAPSAAGPLLNILNAYPLSRLGSSVIDATAPFVTGDSSTSEGGSGVTTRRSYTLSFVLLVGICSFLLGSLLRSLLTPADYIIYRSETAAAAQSDVENALLQAFDPNRRWREARRLLELRSAWGGTFGWDIIVAAVKRE
ncbi:hypothetical protein JCM6882_007558 [Rhodosporidiobolus microsporus]